MKKKPSFFEKLTGTINVDEEQNLGVLDNQKNEEEPEMIEETNNEEDEAQLAVDLYQTPTHIILQTMVAGVRPDDLDISISRESVSIHGKREGPRNIPDEDWFFKDLYWGAFTRTVTLPAEIETEEAEAIENHGLLIIRMPKIDREKKMKIKVKSK